MHSQPKKREIQNIIRLKKTTVVTGTLVSVFGGMFAAIVAIDNFRNYDTPYLFGLTFGFVGLLTGLYVATKIKSSIILNQTMKQNYSLLKLYFSFGFIGAAMLIGQYANHATSIKATCQNYTVVDKIFRKEGYKTVELNILVIDVDGTKKTYDTNRSYWKSVSIGDQINVCLYKSKIGFDFIELPNEK